MPGPTQKLEVSLIDASLAIRHHNPTTGLAGAWEYHPLCSIVSITGQIFSDFALLDTNTMQKSHRYPHTDMSRLVIKTEGNTQPIIDADLSDITNQPTWLPTLAGMETAKADINLWISDACGGSGGGGGTGGGTETDNAVLVDSDFLKTGGKAVDTINYAPAYTEGDAVLAAFDKDNGGLLVNQANLFIEEDNVLNHPGATASDYEMSDHAIFELGEDPTSIKGSAGNIYGWNIINTHTATVYIKFYDSLLEPDPSITNADFVLAVPAGGTVVMAPEVRVKYFTNGIWASQFTTFADLSAGAVPGGTVRTEIMYK